MQKRGFYLSEQQAFLLQSLNMLKHPLNDLKPIATQLKHKLYQTERFDSPFEKLSFA